MESSWNALHIATNRLAQALRALAGSIGGLGEEAAEAIARKEAAMAERIEAGDPVDQVMGASYENMLASSDDEKEIKRDG